jgi:DNA-binding NarL/FixJ family response regulator
MRLSHRLENKDRTRGQLIQIIATMDIKVLHIINYLGIDGRLNLYAATYPEFFRHEQSCNELHLAHEEAHMSKKLLLINDRRGLARTIGSVAPDLGFEIITLDDVAQAARVAEVAPHVVILDLAVSADQMIELLRSVVQTGTDAKILIAARADDPASRVAEGMARFHVGERLAFLRRPFNRRKIVAALQAILGGTASFASSVALIRRGIAERVAPASRTVTPFGRTATGRA